MRRDENTYLPNYLSSNSPSKVFDHVTDGDCASKTDRQTEEVVEHGEGELPYLPT